MASRYWVGGTASWNGTAGTKWSTTSGGAGGAAEPTAADDVFFDANSGAVTVTVDTTPAVCNNLTFIGFTGTFTQAAGSLTISGNLTAAAGMTWNFLTNKTFNATAAGKLITSAGKDLGNLTFNGVGGSWILQDNLPLSTARTITLTNGTLDLNGKTVSAGEFSSNNGNARTLTFNGGALNLAQTGGGGGATWTVQTATNFTLNQGAGTITVNTAGNVTIDHGTTAGATEANSPSIAITDTGALVIKGSLKDLTFNGGFVDTWNTEALTLYGSLTLAAGMTISAGNNAITFAATSGTKTITSNGKTIDCPVIFNGVGGTWQLQDAATFGTSVPATRLTTLTNGTLDLNGKTLTTNRWVSSNANARTVKSSVNGGKIVVTDTTAATTWNMATPTNATIDRASGTWTIEMAGNTANIRTFSGGGLTYPALTFTNTTANGELDFVGSNTFKSLSVSAPPQTLKFTAGTTTTVESDNGFPSGTAGNLVTIGTITVAQHALAKSGGGKISSDYLSISRSDASPGTTWYAGTHSVDGGNNSGWSFTVPPISTTGLLPFLFPRGLGGHG